MRSRFTLVSSLGVLAACGGPGPSRLGEDGPPVATGIDSHPRLFATARVFAGRPDSASPPPTDRLAASGDEYEREIEASLLTADRNPTVAVHPTPSDETDLSNYQAAAWGFDADTASRRRGRWRYHMMYDRFTSGLLVVTLDTAAALGSRATDSLAIAGLGPRERFAMHCRFGRYRPDERVVGVVRDSIRERWMPARLAWFIDTRSARLRAMRTDSIACKLDENPD